MVEIITAIISAASLVTVAVITNRMSKDRKAAELRNTRREKEARLSMDMMMASIELGEINAIALQGGHLNGNVEAARSKADAAKKAYEKWLKDIGANVIN